MTYGFVIAGTDTDVGKTVFSAVLTLATDYSYWKPVQCGLDEGGDRKAVQCMTGLPETRFLPEKYVFSHALSPHRAAELAHISIDVQELSLPDISPGVIIEAAGGLMVPITREVMQIDLIKNWDLPVILCARTGLGTINHTMLSIEAMWAREINLHGIVFIGDENEDNMRTIENFSGVEILGRLPILESLAPESLGQAFQQNFDIESFKVKLR